MSFSFTNPDVDPLSLNERVRKLESRLGPGGSGGGAFVGSIPDFDQYPDNAVKVTNDGVIIKFSFDDLGVNIGLAEVGGVGFKCCGFLPYWGGVLGLPYFICTRLYYKNGALGIPSGTHKNAGKVVPFDSADWVDQLAMPGGLAGNFFTVKLGLWGKTANQTSSSYVFDLTFYTSIQQSTAIPPVLSKNEAQASINLYTTSNTQGVRIEQNSYTFGSYWETNPLYSAYASAGRMVSGQYAQNIGWFNSGTNFFVQNLQQVPPSAHQTYPASWLVP